MTGDAESEAHETELFEGLSEDKLRGRATWAGAALSLSLLMPYEIIDEQPQFLWELFGELPVSGILGAVAEAVAGIVIIAACHTVRGGLRFAMVVVTAMFGAFIVNRIGADASLWGLLPLPESLTARATLALIALSFTSAGTAMAHRPTARRASRLLIYGGLATAVVFYVFPGRGRAPALVIFDYLSVIGSLPTFRHVLGTVTLGVVATWPAIIAISSLLYVRRPPKTATTMLPLVALFGFPLILMMLLFAWFSRDNPASALYAALGAALEVAAVIAILSAAFEMIGQRTFTRPAAEVVPTARVCGAVLIVLSAGMWWLALPPDKGVTWTLGPPSAEADALFAEMIPTWSRARWRWDARARSGDGAPARDWVDMRESGKSVVDAAQRVDPGVASALAEMVATGEQTEASSRAWYRAVAEVNEASRAAALPYYLDPEVRIRKTPEGLWRRFAARTFRVMRARRFDVEGHELSALHVRRLRGRRGSHRIDLLGLSRDVQPFALVVMEANAEHVQELATMAAESPPRCGRIFEEQADDVLAACGERLAAAVETADMTEVVTAVVERHELQHQLDGPLLPMSTPVLDKLGGYSAGAQRRVNRELSAYVAQLTVDVSVPAASLVIPLRFALMQDRGVYHHAAVLMFEALGERRVRDERGRVDPESLGPVFAELAELDAVRLRARAVGAWRRLFGDDLPAVALVDQTSAPDAR